MIREIVMATITMHEYLEIAVNKVADMKRDDVLIHEIDPHKNLDLVNKIREFFKTHDRIRTYLSDRVKGLSEIFKDYLIYIQYYEEYVSFVYRLIDIYLDDFTTFDCRFCRRKSKIDLTPMEYAFHIKGMNPNSNLHRNIATMSTRYINKSTDFEYNLAYSRCNLINAVCSNLRLDVGTEYTTFENTSFSGIPLYIKIFGDMMF